MLSSGTINRGEIPLYTETLKCYRNKIWVHGVCDLASHLFVTAAPKSRSSSGNERAHSSIQDQVDYYESNPYATEESACSEQGIRALLVSRVVIGSALVRRSRSGKSELGASGCLVVLMETVTLPRLICATFRFYHFKIPANNKVESPRHHLAATTNSSLLIDRLFNLVSWAQ